MDPLPFQMDMLNLEIIKPKYHPYFRFIYNNTKRIVTDDMNQHSLSLELINRMFNNWKNENDKEELRIGMLYECLCMVYGEPKNRIWENAVMVE